MQCVCSAWWCCGIYTVYWSCEYAACYSKIKQHVDFKSISVVFLCLNSGAQSQCIKPWYMYTWSVMTCCEHWPLLIICAFFAKSLGSMQASKQSVRTVYFAPLLENWWGLILSWKGYLTLITRRLGFLLYFTMFGWLVSGSIVAVSSHIASLSMQTLVCWTAVNKCMSHVSDAVPMFEMPVRVVCTSCTTYTMYNDGLLLLARRSRCTRHTWACSTKSTEAPMRSAMGNLAAQQVLAACKLAIEDKRNFRKLVSITASASYVKTCTVPQKSAFTTRFTVFNMQQINPSYTVLCGTWMTCLDQTLLMSGCCNLPLEEPCNYRKSIYSNPSWKADLPRDRRWKLLGPYNDLQCFSKLLYDSLSRSLLSLLMLHLSILAPGGPVFCSQSYRGRGLRVGKAGKVSFPWQPAHLHLRNGLFFALYLPSNSATGSVFYMPDNTNFVGMIDRPRSEIDPLHLQHQCSCALRV